MLAVVAGVGVALAQGEGKAPPLAVPGSVRVERGGTVTIPLRAAGRTPGALRFLVRSEPAAGALGPIQPMDRTSAAVAYSHGGGRGASDGFRFAVQAVDSPVSAPAEIVIEIFDRPAALKTPKEVDFGRVFVGEPVRRVVPVRNTGGLPAALRPTVHAPWRIEAVEPGVLEPSGIAAIHLVCGPSAAGAATAELRIEGFPEASVSLTAEVVLPVEASGSADLTDGSAEVTLTNRTAITLPLELVVPDGLDCKAPARLEAGGSAVVRLAIKPEGPAPAGSVRVRAGPYALEIPLVLPRAAPLLRVPARLEFGNITRSDLATRPLRIENDGAGEARLSIAVPEGVVVRPDPDAAVLAPRSGRDFEVTLLRDSAGPFREKLSVSAPGARAVDIELVGSVTDPPVPPQPPAGTPTEALLAPSARPRPDAATASLPAPAGVAQQFPAPHAHVLLTWPDDPSAAGYIVEARALAFAGDNQPPRIHWNEWPRARFERRDGRVFASLPGALPDSVWFLRVTATDSAGRRSSPSPVVRVTTPPQPAVAWPALLAAALLLAALVAGARMLKAHAAHRRASHARRIARIEEP